MDMHEFYMGNIFDAYEYFGAHKENGTMVFRTFAPNASGVCLVGEFNGWTEQPMNRNGQVFELWCDAADYDQMYKYIIYGADGKRREHCDPYGFGMELRPGFASYTRDLNAYKFTDSEWMQNRTKNFDSPMNIYELHLGSWIKKPVEETDDGEDHAPESWYKYNEIAEKLIDYCKKMSFTHVELMPISEHPADISWATRTQASLLPLRATERRQSLWSSSTGSTTQISALSWISCPCILP